MMNYEEDDELKVYRYPSMSSVQESGFELRVAEGQIADSEITVVLGEKGSGKTTFLNLMAGMPPTTKGAFDSELPEFRTSFKYQDMTEYISKFPDSVRELFECFVLHDYDEYPQFVSDVLVPLKIPQLMDRCAKSLSKAEMDNVALAISLARPALVFVLDEPTLHMDHEQRMVAARVIKHYILHEKKTAIVVEHDLEAAAYLADKVVVLGGTPYVSCVASSPINRDESPLA